MNGSNEIEDLLKVIQEDEDALTSLQQRETDLLQHIDEKGFRSATYRERLMSEENEVSESLRRNKKRLAVIRR